MNKKICLLLACLLLVAACGKQVPDVPEENPVVDLPEDSEINGEEQDNHNIDNVFSPDGNVKPPSIPG